MRDTCHSYLPPAPLLELTSFSPKFFIAFYHLFQGRIWRPYGSQNRSCTVGKLEMSSFQRYQFCSNRSSDGKVMAPGDVTSELRVTRRS
jgi:hypothetical protein